MRLRDWLGSRRWIAAASLLAAASVTPWHGAHAYTYQVILDFCSLEDCEDGFGAYPLILDTQGNLYGVTASGGYSERPSHSGTAFELAAPTSETGWQYLKLRDFCQTPDCPGGSAPSGQFTYAGASQGARYDGISTLYDTDEFIPGPCDKQTDLCDAGVVYGLTPSGTPAKWTATTMRTFTGNSGGLSGVTIDEYGNLFALRVDRILKLTPPTGRGEWAATEIYRFCSKPACADGQYPIGPLIFDSAHNLYGTTYGGGNNGTASSAGVVYELMPPAAHDAKWTEKLLYIFCRSGNCPDGANPTAPLLRDAAGNLYGTTEFGGSGGGGTVAEGGGTAFMLTPPAVKGGEWTFTHLYDFCSDYVGLNCLDGDRPSALIMDSEGNLFGTTFYGGSYGAGTVFELSPPAGSGATWTQTILYNFCLPAGEHGGPTGCPESITGAGEGAGPTSLVMDAAGNLYGTTAMGGLIGDYNDYGAGMVFELVK
jgi:uncharacterized repeat protein (TIGR03803 family)